jgi:hyperosmotically inducible periplasmic protein
MRSLGVVVLGGLIPLFVIAEVVAQEGTGQRIGKKVDQAIGQLREEAKDVAGKVKNGFEEARASVDRLGVEGRVYARLHSDKALNGASISVDVGKDGNATLRGTVPNEAAKVKADQLAADTVGVQRVVNDVTVQPSVAP